MTYKVYTKDKLLDYLSASGPYNTLTVAQARARFGIKNVAARIRELRLEGFPIYTNVKTLEDGRTIRVYRLGRGSNRFYRNLDAQRTQIALKSLYTVAA